MSAAPVADAPDVRSPRAMDWRRNRALAVMEMKKCCLTDILQEMQPLRLLKVA